MGARYLVRRVATALFTIVLIVLLNFVLFRAMPGSPERILLGRMPGVTAEVLAATRARWGLDKPLFPDQFVAYLGVHGPGRPRVLVRRPRPPVTRGARPAALADAPPVRPRASWSRSSSASRWAPTRAGDAAAPSTTSATALSLILYSMPYFLLGMAPAPRSSPRASAGSRPSGCSRPGRRTPTRWISSLDLGAHLVAAARHGRPRA